MKVLVGPLVRHHPIPAIPGAKRFACTDCGEEVWIAPSGIEALADDDAIMCLPCASQVPHARFLLHTSPRAISEVRAFYGRGN